MSGPNIRTTAAQISYAVIYKKTNLSAAFKQRLTAKYPNTTKSAIKALCFTTIRNYLSLEDRWLIHVNKRPKDKLVRVIITQALTEFIYMDKPKHAVVNEAINTAKKLNKQWACALINSTLRKTVETTSHLGTNTAAQFSHPQWWIDKFTADWTNQWQQILIANNQKPPLWIRARKTPPAALLPQPHSTIPNAYKIPAQDITQIKEFQDGDISVQDASAQLAAFIIDPQDDERILDACAAPGGKTGHLLELNNNIQLDALELYPNRAKKIHANLHRLKLNANVIVADASQPQDWFSGKKYQKILLDAPCSAAGIIRRQPDIKFTREPDDLLKICQTQQNLLSAMAQLLEVNGSLLYVTCSVFNQENSNQIKNFIKTHPEFSEIKLNYPFATNCEYGIQIISGNEDMDGFYYCYLNKNDV
ncbi:16S rRNA (cytosine(967)-C(5))-methyltransferase [hydrothermal vent metagenome]|uniref:16S rRNA (cytosine(967)-C(5))-methyltransferase n=1 Tax=hydrothermal vent metagenome TaxID=652676 RepID=A0A3B0VWE1_9ZZZZ